ncbi:MAG: hypothetical protein KAT05_01405 [Spirochaetes bacterium]|nr:hypothetical protein [Spirochaetota bacterium]
MITNEEKQIIINYADKYQVEKVILFGSSSYSDNYNDIDIGVKGIRPELFFDFYSKLFFSLSKTVDIVNLDYENSFNQLIEQDGVKIYETAQ